MLLFEGNRVMLFKTALALMELYGSFFFFKLTSVKGCFYLSVFED